MKSKLGTTLRKVRKGKQVSLCSVADEHLSKSQISRFERGESEISCIRLINILDKLHITLDELLILHIRTISIPNRLLTSFSTFVNNTRLKVSIIYLVCEECIKVA